jgi:hypothetical protein
MRPPVFRGRVDEKGEKLTFDNRARFMEYMKGFAGKRVEFILRERTTNRSLRANAYYWSVVLPMLADYVGHDKKEDMHLDLKKHFNVKSTSEMKVEEFQEYLAKVIRFAAEQGVNIPDADSVDF